MMGVPLPLLDVQTRIPDTVDLFICSSSYEARCRSIPDHIDPERVSVCLVLENENLNQFVSSNADYLRRRFASSAERVLISSDDPLTTADSLSLSLDRVARRGLKTSCVVDVTTFTHESLLILLGLLRKRMDCFNSIQLLYANAGEYSPGEPDADKWLSKGVKEVRSILGFPGDTVPWRPDHLVVLVGYEHERALELAAILQPKTISLGFGKSDREGARQERIAARFFKLVFSASAVYGSVRQFQFSCQQPSEAARAVLEQIDSLEGVNTIVAPMNTKLSTVGCFLAAISQPSIQLSYAQAMTYNVRGYSTPGDSFYAFDLTGHLESLDALPNPVL